MNRRTVISKFVSDTGPGISEENREQCIFTPFFTTKEPERNRPGLPLAYGIIKMHKGEDCSYIER
ncbi:MAG: ATP-binding protein [Bacteroidales bacterium]